MSDNNPDLDTVDLRAVIKTHILGRQPNHLIPIKLLTQIDLSCDYVSEEGDLGYLSQAEKNRLLAHSIQTQAINEVINLYRFYTDDQASLLGQLNSLIKALYSNSDKGVGTEKEAGREVYAVIAEFMRYWNIVKTDKSIPNSLKKEINLIIRWDLI